MRVACIGVLALAACGRIGFDPFGDSGATDAPGSSRWRLNQVGDVMGGNQVALNATEQGALVIVATNILPGDAVVSISDGMGSTYENVPGARCVNGGSGPVEIWYAAGVPANVLAIDVTTAVTPPVAFVVWEVANMRTSSVLDTTNQLSTQPATSEPLGAPVTTTAPGAFVVSVVKATIVMGIPSGDPFTLDSLVSNDGYAHLDDPNSPAGTYQSHWTSNVAEYCASTAAFFVGP